MKSLKLMLAICTLPAALLAQQAATGQDSTATRSRTTVEAKSQGSINAAIPGSLSADGRADLEVVLQKAREHALPVQAIQNRVAEGLAKGASEAQIILAASALEARLEASQRAMVRAGREQPTADEVQGGAGAMERGATEAQIRVLVEHTPSDRSLVVAFDVLSALAADGRPVGQALAQIQGKLDSRANDAAIISLTGSVNAHGNAASNGNGAQPAAGSSGSPQSASQGAAQVGASVAGTVGAVIRR